MSVPVEVNSVTYNKVNVTWKISNCYMNNSSCTSSAFSIISGGQAIVFSMVASLGEKLVVKVTKGTAKDGRGIITLSVKCDEHIDVVKCLLQEKWDKHCTFKNLGPLPRSNTSTKDVVITCDIKWLGFDDESEDTTNVYPWIITPAAFDNQLISDVKIVVEGKDLAAHKAILALYSPVLLAMFETPMKESKENCVIIEDIEFSTIETLLRIIYTGEVNDLNEIDVALKVLEAAEKYQMLSVKLACEYKLQMKMRAHNVLMLLEEANRYNAMDLCQTCVDYIVATRDTIISKEKFKKMCEERPNLAIAMVKVHMDKLYLIPTEN